MGVIIYMPLRPGALVRYHGSIFDCPLCEHNNVTVMAISALNDEDIYWCRNCDVVFYERDWLNRLDTEMKIVSNRMYGKFGGRKDH